MTLVTASFIDVALNPDNPSVVFEVPTLRRSASGTMIVTSRSVPGEVLDGILTPVELDSGQVAVRVGGGPRMWMSVPSGTSTVDMWDILDDTDDVEPPPAGAIFVKTIAGRSGVVTAQQVADDVSPLLPPAAPAAHTHVPADVVGLTEYVHDTVGALIKAGTNVTVNYDDAANTFTINASGGGGGTTDPEIVRDVIGGALAAGSGISVNVNDAADTITIAVASVPQSTVTGLSDTITGINTQLDSKATTAAVNIEFAKVQYTNQKGQPNGYASLGADSKVLPAQLPSPIYQSTTAPTSPITGDLWLDTNTTPAVSLTKSDVGLSNVDNTSDAQKPVSTAQAAADALRQLLSEKNQPNGYAGIGSDGFLPSALLPSYVDDVIEYANFAAFPATNTSGRMYLDVQLGKIYRWSGSTYVEISPSPGSTDSVTEGATNLYYTAGRADTRVTAGLTARTLGTGTGLTGGGNLGADRTIALTTAAQASLAKADTATQPADLSTAVAAAQLVTANAQTAAYTLVAADAGKVVEVTAAAGVAVTVPPSSSVNYPIGTVIEVVQTGAGQVTITAGSGVTINTSSTLLTRAQWSSVALRKRAADTWILLGDTA